MKVLQETPSLCLVQDPFLNSVNSEGLKEAPEPPPHPALPSLHKLNYVFIRIVGIASVWSEHSWWRRRWRLISCCLNYQNDVLLICGKNVLLHSVFCLFDFSAELIQLLSSVFTMEIFDWSAGLLLDFIH